MHVESDDRQAVEIAELSGRPVLSVERQRMTWPTSRTEVARMRFQREKGSDRDMGQGLRQGIVHMMRGSAMGEAFIQRLRSMRV